MQDVYNGIGIVAANRENNEEALPYLNSAIDVYLQATMECKIEDKSSVFKDFTMSPLDKYLLRSDEQD